MSIHKDRHKKDLLNSANHTNSSKPIHDIFTTNKNLNFEPKNHLIVRTLKL